jgi:hypothetical protein
LRLWRWRRDEEEDDFFRLLLRLRRSGLLDGDEAEGGESDESESVDGEASRDLFWLRRLVSFPSLPISFCLFLSRVGCWDSEGKVDEFEEPGGEGLKER